MLLLYSAGIVVVVIQPGYGVVMGRATVMVGAAAHVGHTGSSEPRLSKSARKFQKRKAAFKTANNPTVENGESS